DGKDGASGQDGQPGLNGADGLPGKDGLNGADGKNGLDAPEPEFFKGLIEAQVEIVLAGWAKPQDGKDGRDGVDGKDGQPGVDGVSIDFDSVTDFVESTVETAVARIPVPAGPVSVVRGYIDRDGNLCHTFSDGSVQTLGMVVGRDGRDVDAEAVY